MKHNPLPLKPDTPSDMFRQSEPESEIIAICPCVSVSLWVCVHVCSLGFSGMRGHG